MAFAETDEPSSPGEPPTSIYLYTHNDARATFCAQPLTWSDELASKAQQWADGCQFQHTEGKMGPYGENIAAGTGDFTIPKAMGMFLKDMATLDPANPTFSDFTQIIWQNSTRLGCASAQCSGIFDPGLGNATMHVCFYDPVGNVVGELL
ncbi:CAP domain-containing protein [Phlebopus sp. FC_14]|nr:CAP domain-containing protein [Phlebopus sp. FC_14]